MRILLQSLLLMVMSVNLVAQLPAAAAVTDPQKIQSRAKPDLQKFSIEKLYMTRAMGAAAWSPDGKQIVFVSNISGRENLWLVSAQGGWPMQLTVSDQRQDTPAWSSDGKWIAYISDYDGNEQWDLFLVSPLNGQVINLTNTPEIAEESPAWSPDGRTLAYIVKPRTSPTYELHLIDVLTLKTRALTSATPKELGNFSPIWSRDGKWLAYTQRHANDKDASIFIVEIATGKSTNLTPHSGEQLHIATDWSPDGKRLLITSNAGNGYDNAALLDLATKKLDWLTQDKWEVSAGHFAPDGKLLTWTANVDGNTDVFLYDLATRRPQPLPLRKGVNSLGGAESAFTNDGSRLLFFHNGPDAPNDAWVYSLPNRTSQQVTFSLIAGLRGEDMVEPFLVHYPSTDGKFQVSAFAYVPYNMQRDGRNPAIVYVHGGPAWQSFNSFQRLPQYLVNQGYIVIAPNYRGSTGYGKEFMDANRFDMGGGDLADVIAAAEWIKKTGYVDPKKLVLMGGSYGGYMTMMGVTKAPSLWAAGVPIVPFVNWFTEVENEDPLLREYDLATMGDPVKNKDLWTDRSPIFFVDRIQAPLLLLAGGNDPRCPKSETLQVVEAVRKRGGVIDYKVYENEGHGFSRVENQIDAYNRVAQFLKKHVPPADCGCSVAPQ